MTDNEADGTVVIPEGIRQLRVLAGKPYPVQVGAETVYFRKDTYAIQNALSAGVKAISDGVGLAPEAPKDDAGQDEQLRWLEEIEAYRARSNEALVRIAATVKLHKEVTKDGKPLFKGASVEDIVGVLTVPDAQRFMAAYGAFQSGLQKVPDAGARFP